MLKLAITGVVSVSPREIKLANKRIAIDFHVDCGPGQIYCFIVFEGEEMKARLMETLKVTNPVYVEGTPMNKVLQTKNEKYFPVLYCEAEFVKGMDTSIVDENDNVREEKHEPKTMSDQLENKPKPVKPKAKPKTVKMIPTT